jgi:hypothetical protein
MKFQEKLYNGCNTMIRPFKHLVVFLKVIYISLYNNITQFFSFIICLFVCLFLRSYAKGAIPELNAAIARGEPGTRRPPFEYCLPG